MESSDFIGGSYVPFPYFRSSWTFECSLGKEVLFISKFSAPTIAFLAFDWLKNSDYEPIVRVLPHMENSAPSSLSGRSVKLWK